METTKLPFLKIEGIGDVNKTVKSHSETNASTFSIKTDAKLYKGKILPLIAEDDPFLKQTCEKYDFDNKFISPITLAQSLILSMKAYGGVGLSAIQVGYPLRVFVVGYEDQNQVFFNPEIVSTSVEKTKMKEGCISYPFCYALVERPEKIRIRFQNEKAEWQEKDFSGYTARIIQHEYDHLDGITLPDKVSSVTWKLIKDRGNKHFKKALRQEKKKSRT